MEKLKQRYVFRSEKQEFRNMPVQNSMFIDLYINLIMHIWWLYLDKD